MYDDFHDRWRSRWRALLLRIAGGTAVVALVLAAYWARTHVPPPAREGILDAFVAGFVPSEWDAKDALADVPRPELHIALAQLLRPATTDTYAVIIGEHGSGKSTAVRKAARASSADGASGVVFIEIREVRSFSLKLASCLNLDLTIKDEKVSPLPTSRSRRGTGCHSVTRSLRLLGTFAAFTRAR